MKNQEIYCEEETMDSIYDKFERCEAETQKLINAVSQMHQSIQKGYGGMAEQASDACFELLLKHLTVLEKSYAQMKQATCEAKEAYFNVDSKQAKAIQAKE